LGVSILLLSSSTGFLTAIPSLLCIYHLELAALIHSWCSSAGRGQRSVTNDRNTKSGRGGGEGRGEGRGGRAPTRDGKRAYDRRSGTGRGKEIKKDGGGARNWGSEKEDAKKMEGKVVDGDVKEEKPAAVVAAEGETPEVEVPAEPAPKDNTLTYAEYMAAKGKTEATKMREVDNDFKGLAAAKKVETDFLVMGGDKAKKTKKKKDQKKSLEVGFRTVRY
jgi:plasminogen activator inhibitor 1 RNA-binding protein